MATNRSFTATLAASARSPAVATTSPPVSLAEVRLQQETQKRGGQLFDENDHKRCSDGNRKALLADKMEHLRGLAKEFEGDDWKYAAPASVVAASATNSILGDAQLELGGGGCDGSPMMTDDGDDLFLRYVDGAAASSGGTATF